jgi:arylsulfatase A-like enzyme
MGNSGKDNMQAWARTGTAILAAVVLAALAAAALAQPILAAPGAVPASSTAAFDAGAGPDERPNIVFVMTDDMRDDDLRYLPHTRALIADKGMDFTDAISPHPLCCPARAELVTGQFAQNNGVQHNVGPFGGFQALDPTHEISSWFGDGGYRSAFIGKFLNGYGADEVRPSGWSRWDALVSGVYDYRDFGFADDDETPEDFTDSYVTDVISERTNEAVRDFSERDEPFLIYSWHLAPHYRINDQGEKSLPPSAPEDRGRFADAEPPAIEEPVFNERRISDQPRPFRNRQASDVQDVVDEHRARLRSLQAVDRSVESLVRTLRQTGELDNTYIVFSSDNGYSLGEHRFVGKNVLSQPVLQVPLLVRGPDVVAGSTSDLPVTLVDLPATFAALGDVSPGWMVDGTSVVPTLHSQDQPFRDTTLVQTGEESGDGWAYRGVRTSRFLYGMNGSDGFLYDRLLDPEELVNRVDDPAYAAIRAQLEQRRTQLLSCTGWTCNQQFGPLPEPS